VQNLLISIRKRRAWRFLRSFTQNDQSRIDYSRRLLYKCFQCWIVGPCEAFNVSLRWSVHDCVQAEPLSWSLHLPCEKLINTSKLRHAAPRTLLKHNPDSYLLTSLFRRRLVPHKRPRRRHIRRNLTFAGRGGLRLP